MHSTHVFLNTILSTSHEEILNQETSLNLTEWKNQFILDSLTQNITLKHR